MGIMGPVGLKEMEFHGSTKSLAGPPTALRDHVEPSSSPGQVGPTPQGPMTPAVVDAELQLASP